MQRRPVESTMLRSVGYDAEQQVLELEFSSGKVYEYADVPASVHRELLAAESLGRFFREEIDGAYRYWQVRRGGSGRRSAHHR